jgi:O-antigen ligase
VKVNVRSWILPLLVAVALLGAFATRGGDTNTPSLIMMTAMAALCAVAWALPANQTPSIGRRPEFLLVVGAAVLLAMVLAFQPVLLGLVRSSSGISGLYDPSRANLEYLKLAGVACAFALAFRVSLNDESGRNLLDAIIMMGGGWAAIAIIMHVLDPNGIYGVQKIAGSGRLQGAFSSPNSAGTLFGAISAMAFGRVLSRFWSIRARGVFERIDPVFLGVWLLSLSALVLTMSRMAVVSTAIVTLGLAFVLCWRRAPMKWLITGVAVGSLVMIGVLVTPMLAIVQRVRDLNSDGHVRTIIMSEHLKVALHQLWIGSGFGSFNAVNNSILTNFNYPYLSPIQAMHNVYLQWLEEVGILGLVCLLLVNVAVLWPIYRAAPRRQTMGSRLWIILGAYVVFLIHGLTDYAFQEPALELFTAVLLGAGFAIATNSGRRPG